MQLFENWGCSSPPSKSRWDLAGCRDVVLAAQKRRMTDTHTHDGCTEAWGERLESSKREVAQVVKKNDWDSFQPLQIVRLEQQVGRQI